MALWAPCFWCDLSWFISMTSCVICLVYLNCGQFMCKAPVTYANSHSQADGSIMTWSENISLPQMSYLQAPAVGKETWSLHYWGVYPVISIDRSLSLFYCSQRRHDNIMLYQDGITKPMPCFSSNRPWFASIDFGVWLQFWSWVEKITATVVDHYFKFPVHGISSLLVEFVFDWLLKA